MNTPNDDGLTAAPDLTLVDEPAVLDEIEVEDLAVDGICGVY